MAETNAGEGRGTRRQRPDRLDGLGERVATVAHELKVPLSLIIGSLESLQYYVASLVERIAELEGGGGARPPSPPLTPRPIHAVDNATALVRICREGAYRLERVVQEIGTYARGGSPVIKLGRVDVARVLRATTDLVARSMIEPPPIRLEIPELPAASADEAALARVVVNVMRNAFAALAGVADPLVRISAEALRDAGRGWIEIRIADNGSGIREEDRPHVFEPFFSGKAFGAGLGLGLGLAIAEDLIESQGGTIRLHPDASSTVFVIRVAVAA